MPPNLTYQEMYNRMCRHLRATCGLSFVVRSKGGSMLMKVIGTILFFNPRFMSDYTTTIGSTVYFPDGYVDDHDGDAAHVLAHEAVHLKQARRDGRIRFSLKYLFPQCLAAFALLAVLAIWWLPALCFLAFLGFLAPLPAPWRVKYEREAYLITAVCDATKGWDVTQDWYEDSMVSHYTGFGYYKPAWREAPVRIFVKEDLALAMKIAKGVVIYPYATELLGVLKHEV